MAQAGDVIENPVTGQRLIFLETAADTDGERFTAEGIFPPGGFAGVPHIHPDQDEHFELLAGEAVFDVEGRRRVLGVAESIDVPRDVKHTFANAGQAEMRVRFEFRPALPSTERFYEIYFAFAQQGRVNAKAIPGLLDIATVWPVTSEHAILASPPAVVQHTLFRALAPVARLARRRPPACRIMAMQARPSH
jgi:mannose-6-phosphate isomerase-like protein (cupin superfamily)